MSEDYNCLDSFSQSEETKLILDYKIQNLNEVLRDFVNVSGVEMMIRDAEFRPLFQRTPPISINRYCEKIHTSKEGRRLCNDSDIKLLQACAKSKRPEYHVCHAGLIDIGIPIQYNNEIKNIKYDTGKSN